MFLKYNSNLDREEELKIRVEDNWGVLLEQHVTCLSMHK